MYRPVAFSSSMSAGLRPLFLNYGSNLSNIQSSSCSHLVSKRHFDKFMNSCSTCVYSRAFLLRHRVDARVQGAGIGCLGESPHRTVQVARPFSRFFGHEQHSKGINFKCNMVFHNLLSLYESSTPNPVGLEVFGRRALLAEALLAKSICVAGFAETRSKERQIDATDYIMVASGHARGQLGCECWIARRFPFITPAGGVKYCSIVPNNVVTVHSGPRLLVVCLQAFNFCIYFVVFHAPHADTGALRGVFWDELEAVLKTLDGHTVVLLGDANARVGSINSESVGNFFPQKQNYNGGRFHSILKLFKLYAPNTFGEFTGGNAVDTHAGNRIDYIALPLSWKRLEQAAWSQVLPATMAADNDHTPTYVSLVTGFGDSDSWIKRRVPSFSISHLRTIISDPSHPTHISIMEDLNYIGNNLVCNSCVNQSLDDACSAVSNVLANNCPKNASKFCANQFISDRTRSFAKQKDWQSQVVRSIKNGLPGFTDLNLATEVAALRDLNKCVKSSANHDRTVWVQNISNQIVVSDKLHNSRNMYKSMRALQRKPPKPVLQMVDSNDSVVNKPLEVRRCF